jgi:hypothetical protein
MDPGELGRHACPFQRTQHVPLLGAVNLVSVAGGEHHGAAGQPPRGKFGDRADRLEGGEVTPERRLHRSLPRAEIRLVLAGDVNDRRINPR